MKIREYLEKKYGRDTSLGLLGCEAKVLGINYPLEKGWLAAVGDYEIPAGKRICLVAALRRSKSQHAAAGIAALEDRNEMAQLHAAAPYLLAALQKSIELADRNKRGAEVLGHKVTRPPEMQAVYDECVAAVAMATEVAS